MTLQSRRIHQPGNFWGDEQLLLFSPELLGDNSGVGLTFVEVLTLGKESFQRVLDDHPHDQPTIRRFQVRYAVRRGILEEARTRKKACRDDKELQVTVDP